VILLILVEERIRSVSSVRKTLFEESLLLILRLIMKRLIGILDVTMRILKRIVC
jgi:hypothetical protein